MIQSQLAMAEQANVSAALEVAIENLAGSMKELTQSVNASKEKLKDMVRRATLQIDEAQTMEE